MAKRIPDFFKVYVPESSCNSLQIPLGFIAQLNQLKPKKVKLTNQVGQDWCVRVAYVEKMAYFENGWQKFVEDNHLEKFDILVFKYYNDNKFRVKILGKSGCEKRTSYIEKEVEEDNEDVVEVYDIRSDTNEDADDKVINRTSCRGGGSKKRRMDVAKARRFITVDDLALLGVDVRTYVKHPNPYFVSRAWPGSRKNFLNIPVYLFKHFGLALAETINVNDGCGHSCDVERKIWKDGRIGITGWAAFCKISRLRKSDIIICEFIHAGEMRVHKVPVVNEVGPQSKG